MLLLVFCYHIITVMTKFRYRILVSYFGSYPIHPLKLTAANKFKVFVITGLAGNSTQMPA